MTTMFQAVANLWPESDSEISVSKPVFYGVDAYTIVTNSGDRAGSVEDAYLSSSFLPVTIKFEPNSPNDRLIAPGTKQIAFSSVFPGLGPREAMEFASIVNSRNPSSSGSEPAGALAVAVRNSNGELDEIFVDVSH